MGSYEIIFVGVVQRVSYSLLRVTFPFKIEISLCCRQDVKLEQNGKFSMWLKTRMILAKKKAKIAKREDGVFT